jgi:dGTPase
VDFLADHGRGLNLTWEVRNGILKHSKGYRDILPEDTSVLPATMEGKVVRVADIMAYVNHDLDDAIRAGMIKKSDLPAHLRKVVGDTTSQRIDAMVRDLITSTMDLDDGDLHLSTKMNETITELRTFLYDNVYRNWLVHNEFEKAQRIIRDLYGFFLEHEFPRKGHGDCPPRPHIFTAEEEKKRHREVCDFIAGMTDRYALGLYKLIFMPKPWSVF